jgi:SPP1 family phage portal protein
MKNAYTGRKMIKIPVENIDKTSLEKYLPEILGVFFNNQCEFDALDLYYKGEQDILKKEKVVRPTINNVTLENHAFEMVEFLKGYMVGRPIKYSQVVTGASTDDVTMLNTYMFDQNKATKDTTLLENMAKGGVGYYMILPKSSDYYVDKKFLGKTVKRTLLYNVDKEAPFDIYLQDPRNTFVVYSSYTGNKKLCGGCITKIGDNEHRLTIYAPNTVYTADCSSIAPYSIRNLKEEAIDLPFCPIIEYKLNASRIGIIEIVKSMLDTLNKISSNQMDDIEQFVNSVMVFTNQDIDKAKFTELLELGAVNIKSISPQFPADVKMLSQSLNHTDINTYYQRIYDKMMGIVAIPKAGDRAQSGGDTGQARLLGEGWTLADQRAMTYQNMITESERELLTIILYICRNTPECKINELYPSDIEVKFSRSKSDNMLVKSQVILNLQAAKIPEEIIAQVCELFDAPLEVSEAWKANIEAAKVEQQEMFDKQNQEKQDNTDNNLDNRVKTSDKEDE